MVSTAQSSRACPACSSTGTTGVWFSRGRVSPSPRRTNTRSARSSRAAVWPLSTAPPAAAEAVVTSLNAGGADYLESPRQDRESLVLQATCAMPLMFPIYHINGQPYLDGGVGDAIPWRRALEQGCDRVLVVLTRPREYRRRPDKLLPLVRKKYREYPNFVAAMEQRAQVYNQDREELFRAEREGRLLVIAPRSTLGVSRTERNTEKLRLLWAAGYQDAVDRLEEIQDFFSR